MLDADTKRRIDSCRDMLVGKVPDPKSQVEQITIALIYKFMDDMDAEAEELGGARSFFAGEYARYGWARLLSPTLGGFEMLALYGEAISTMGANPGVPPLFRDIFKNAYLPYRDPETLRAFLKEINGFTYDHSERLGDAFEYLLSVLGSQGDAGQFRTPRHIIDFIVAVVDPQKAETILDPACGTAGFLISSYKHILAANRRPALTADERARLARSLVGYDISPDMVRLSLVNLYLHGFPRPQIIEYDTLTSDEQWPHYFDVILANPPFMSPKGGIKPHKRFSVQSSRSEVLFVDYIAEHLTPQGRAGVIVPEGIIFQSGGAYKSLRKMLVDNHLVAVVSLPAGVFQPYSGVKTSILILDRHSAKCSDSVLFVKIASDGFGLGAQRRAVATNDLPDAARQLRAWRESLRDGTPFDAAGAANVQVVPKAKIAATGEYNLSADRYLSAVAHLSEYEVVALGSVCEYVRGVVYSKQDEVTEDGWAVLRANNINQTSSTLDLSDIRLISKTVQLNERQKLRQGDTLICAASGSADHVGKVAYSERDTDYYFGGFMAVLRAQPTMLPQYLFACLKTKRFRAHIAQHIIGANIQNLKASIVYDFTIPLPPLAVQQEIVAEIESYQKVIDGARQVVENYKPRIRVRPEWPVVELGEVAATSSGGTPSKAEATYWIGNIPWVSPKDMKVDFIHETEDHISEAAVLDSAAKMVQANTLLCVVRSGILQHTFPVAITMQEMCFNQDITAISPADSRLNIYYLFYYFKAHGQAILTSGIKPGVTVQSFHSGFFKSYKLPLPDLDTQRAIVAEIEEEQRLVAASRELVRRFEGKITEAIRRVWGEEVPEAPPPQ